MAHGLTNHPQDGDKRVGCPSVLHASVVTVPRSVVSQLLLGRGEELQSSPSLVIFQPVEVQHHFEKPSPAGVVAGHDSGSRDGAAALALASAGLA